METNELITWVIQLHNFIYLLDKKLINVTASADYNMEIFINLD